MNINAQNELKRTRPEFRKNNLIEMVKNTVLKRKMKEELNDRTRSECSSSLPHFSKRVMDSSDQKRHTKSAPSSIAGHCNSPYHTGMEDISPPGGGHYDLAQYFSNLTSLGLFQFGVGTSAPMLPTSTGWFSGNRFLISSRFIIFA